jgi:hypothetical protein
MRFAARALIGAAAATALVALPAATANAATATAAAPAAAGASATTPFHAEWGPFYTADDKGYAEGTVHVEKKSYKKWYWKYYTKPVKKCWWKHGEKKCTWVKKTFKKKVWKWAHDYHYTVDSTLYNTKHHPYTCTWETFKIVNFHGHTAYKSYKNCYEHPAEYSFWGKNAKEIYVQVSRGDSNEPKGEHSAWEQIYQSA